MRNQVTIFLPMYSLLTTYFAHTSEWVNGWLCNSLLGEALGGFSNP